MRRNVSATSGGVFCTIIPLPLSQTQLIIIFNRRIARTVGRKILLEFGVVWPFIDNFSLFSKLKNNDGEKQNRCVYSCTSRIF